MAVESRRPEVVAIYYPLWHNYDHASSWNDVKTSRIARESVRREASSA